MPRLFIYHIEAKLKTAPEYEILAGQFKIMEQRLWKIITWPSAVLCTLTAVALLWIMPAWLTQGWMHAKLLFVLCLWGYHLATHRMYLKFQANTFNYSSQFMRIWNEGATLVLFAVVFLVIYKAALDGFLGLLGLLCLVVALGIGIKAYKRIRARQGHKN